MPRSSAIVRVKEWLLGLLAPASCPACDQASAFDEFCETCGAELAFRSEPSFASGIAVYAGVAFDCPVRPALHAFKYGRRPDLASALSRLSEPLLRRYPRSPGALWVPVPLHPKRLTERGYNQAALLARHWAAGAHGKYAPLVLRRSVDTPHQAHQGVEARLANVAQAFTVRKPAQIVGQRVVLVDDVLTTGATAQSCVRVLTAAGAEVEAIVTVAIAGADVPNRRNQPRPRNPAVSDLGALPERPPCPL